MTTIKVTSIGAPNARTSTSETFALGDEVAGATFDNPSPITATVPANSTVAFPIGVQILFAQIGDGQATIAPGSGVTVLQIDSKYKLRGKGAGATLWKIAANLWLLFGDLTA